MTVDQRLTKRGLVFVIGIFMSVGGSFWVGTFLSNATEADESGVPYWGVMFFDGDFDDPGPTGQRRPSRVPGHR